jgi:hypothetical protein
MLDILYLKGTVTTVVSQRSQITSEMHHRTRIILLPLGAL